jgi:hypothetical protein
MAEVRLPTVTVVVCAYTTERWDWLLSLIDSIRAQTYSPQKVVVVIDHNEELYARLAGIVDDVTVVRNSGPRGLSGARNTGLDTVDSDIVAFIDDDAEAAPDWLERLAALYDDPDVLAVGGRVDPIWEAGRPGFLGHELDWIVGCSHRGMPRVASEVRNVIGANMSFRLSVIRQVGGFNLSLGRQGSVPSGCEKPKSAYGRPWGRLGHGSSTSQQQWCVIMCPRTGRLSATCWPGPGPRAFPRRGSARSGLQTGAGFRTPVRPQRPAPCFSRRVV